MTAPSMTKKEMAERDAEIFRLWTEKYCSQRYLADKYGLSVIRIAQILEKERYLRRIQKTPIEEMTSLCDMMTVLFDDVLPEEGSANFSIRMLLQCTVRHLRNLEYEWKYGPNWKSRISLHEPDVEPAEWVKWIKNVSYEDMMKIHGMGPKKTKVLMQIRDRIQKEPETEAILLKAERLF